MNKKIDISNWNRKEHFEFFSSFDEPFFGIVAEVDCTKAYIQAKENKHSFFAYYLYRSLQAVNEVEEFKTRISGNDVVVFDEIHAAATIGREDGTFGFSFVHFTSEFKNFQEALKEEVKKVQESTGIRLNEDAIRLDAIHFSTIPWQSFTGLTHSRNFKFQDSTPKITFGKMFLRDGKKIMPVAVNVHHGLVDAFHVSKFLDVFQALMDE